MVQYDNNLTKDWLITVLEDVGVNQENGSIKFRIKDDELVCLKVLGEGEELLFVTEKGVIVRTNADKISQQSRAATGVKLQRLDEGDHLSEVVLVPHEQTEETDQFNQGKEN